jgi:hypothetical protein
MDSCFSAASPEYKRRTGTSWHHWRTGVVRVQALRRTASASADRCCSVSPHIEPGGQAQFSWIYPLRDGAQVQLNSSYSQPGRTGEARHRAADRRSSTAVPSGVVLPADRYLTDRRGSARRTGPSRRRLAWAYRCYQTSRSR